MKLKPLVGIVLSITLFFAFCGQTAFASTFEAVQDYAQKYIAHGQSSNTPAIATPTANVTSGTYKSSLAVTLSGTYRKQADLYYTLDGTTPTTNSQVYNKPITLTASCNLKAFAVDSSGNTSGVLNNTYTILTAPSKTTPSISDGKHYKEATPSDSASSPDPSPSASPVVSPEPSSSPSAVPSAAPSQSAAPSSSPSAIPSTTPIAPSALSAWVAYWDWQDGLKEVNAMPQKPGSIELFGACFNSDDKLFYPDEMKSMPEAAKAMQSANPGMQVYLTVVNDRLDANGKWTDKDSGMLDRIMKSDTSRASNINDILNMVSQGNYNGVEIDYEEFSDTAWKGFTVYCSQLYDALKAKGLGIRVCLESYAPFDEGSLPAGPEYTIMAYSLHWEDSEPGPRADYAFIGQVAQKLQALPGNKRMAFAAGGYDWANGSGKELTEAEAAQLAQKSTNVQRDSQSGALHFTYKSNGTTHTVWYSDEQTINSWINQANSLGISNTAVWKMGGNMPQTVQMLGGSH